MQGYSAQQLMLKPGEQGSLADRLAALSPAHAGEIRSMSPEDLAELEAELCAEGISTDEPAPAAEPIDKVAKGGGAAIQRKPSARAVVQHKKGNTEAWKGRSTKGAGPEGSTYTGAEDALQQIWKYLDGSPDASGLVKLCHQLTTAQREELGQDVRFFEEVEGFANAA